MGYFKRKLRRGAERQAKLAAGASGLPASLELWLAAPPTSSSSPRYIRLAVARRDEDSLQPCGIFIAAYELQDCAELDEGDVLLLRELLEFFEKRLPIPRPANRRAIFWFKSNAQEFIGRVWELVRLFRQYGIDTRMCITDEPGRIVYDDAYQVAAVPPFRLDY